MTFSSGLTAARRAASSGRTAGAGGAAGGGSDSSMRANSGRSLLIARVFLPAHRWVRAPVTVARVVWSRGEFTALDRVDGLDETRLPVLQQRLDIRALVHLRVFPVVERKICGGRERALDATRLGERVRLAEPVHRQ